jgi:hypothetical protein
VAAAAALTSLRGHAFSTSDAALAEALSAAGASALRHAHEMSHPLQSIPADDIAPGLAVEPLSATQVNRYADDLGAVHVASYRWDTPTMLPTTPRRQPRRCARSAAVSC